MRKAVATSYAGTCACGWPAPDHDALRAAEKHAALTGHRLTIVITRAVTIDGRADG